jgi:hypothetical protein
VNGEHFVMQCFASRDTADRSANVGAPKQLAFSR